MLYYCPLESYPDRYSSQLSAPETGWHERNWRKAGVDYIRLDNLYEGDMTDSTAFNFAKRFQQSVTQVEAIIHRLQGPLQPKPTDVVLFDEFWSPGIEMIPFALGERRPRLYATLWAQSVDEYDFTYNMRHWLRHFEKGIATILDGIFVATPLLKKLVVRELGVPRDKVHAVGHPFSSEEVKSRMDFSKPREDKVIFSSRWDWEKRPAFFLKVVEEVLERNPGIQFVITTSQKKLRSNMARGLDALHESMKKYPNNLILKEGLTKEEYYQELTTAKIIFNCALQDWISYGLLEGACAGCYPVYPNFRSFKEVFHGAPQYLYDPTSPLAAANRICELIRQHRFWEPDSITIRQWVHDRFDTTWLRMLDVMGVHTKLWFPHQTPEELWRGVE